MKRSSGFSTGTKIMLSINFTGASREGNNLTKVGSRALDILYPCIIIHITMYPVRSPLWSLTILLCRIIGDRRCSDNLRSIIHKINDDGIIIIMYTVSLLLPSTFLPFPSPSPGTQAYGVRSVIPSFASTSSSMRNCPVCSPLGLVITAYAASAIISGLREDFTPASPASISTATVAITTGTMFTYSIKRSIVTTND